MKKQITILLSACLVILPSCLEKQDKDSKGKDEKESKEKEFVYHKDGEPYDTFEGLVMCGYQGWFGAPGDGCRHNDASNCVWYHYRESEMFKPGAKQNSIDFWPDVSEYEKVYKTDFKFKNGDPAYVFSSVDKSTTMLHFKWMQEYGIDGVFMQRFFTEIMGDMGRDHFDKVLANAMEASNTYQRAISIMYDLSGFDNSRLSAQDLINDARSIMNRYQLKNRNKQKFYLYEKERPLICLWGVGFNDNRKYTLEDVDKMIDGLHQLGYSVLLGVPAKWRTLDGDTVSDSKLFDLIKKSEAFFPWLVGRFDGTAGLNSYKSRFSDDFKWAKDNNVVYANLCFPGFSWNNMFPDSARTDRQKGLFFWKQIYTSIQLGAKCLYIAMFDEIDEGTAIFKVMNKSNVPSNVPENEYYVLYENGSYKWLSEYKEPTLSGGWCKKGSELNIEFQGIEDELPTDHYLWLTGMAGKMLRKEIPLSPAMPARK